MKDFSDYGITIPNGRVSGQVVTLCPECSHNRKASNRKVKCLSVNLDKKVWNCKNCDWRGGIVQREVKEYFRPTFSNRTNLSINTIDWFLKRGITVETLNHFKITEQMEFMPQEGKEMNTIGFNYFRDSKLVNTKYRDGKKNFKLVKDAELIFYNIDTLKESTEVYICEGEIDCITLYQNGVINTVSVPNGASVGNNNLIYLDNCIEDFNNITKFHICTDNDIAGRKLREDLALRFGKENCDYIVFKDCKDANDCLQKHGNAGIMEAISDKRDFPFEGSFTIEDFEDEIDDFYDNGLPPGGKTGLFYIDEKISFHLGYISVITGIPSHGKTQILDFLIVRLLLNELWMGAFYSPENKPTKLHFSKLSRILTGKSWDGQYRLSRVEKDLCKRFLNDKFWFIKPEKDFTLDSILSSVIQLIKRKGIKFFVIDAWNKLEHIDDSTSYIGKSLDKIAVFCEVNEVHCFLVAHPTKMKKMPDLTMEVPTLYDISGSANFFNKADLGLCVYRNFSTNTTMLNVQKVKFQHWGNTGQVDLAYEPVSGRYYLNGSAYDIAPYIRENSEGKIINCVKSYQTQIEEIIEEPFIAPF